MLASVRQTGMLRHCEVTQVEVWAEVWEPGKPKAKAVTFQVGCPNSCSLKHEGMDDRLRTMLVASGIEPKAPPSADENGQAAG